MMRCNVCWLQLSHADRVYATQCSHVLCHDCSTKHFSRNQLTCPVCATNLEPHGLALIDLTPSSDKIKALCGLDPSFILQIASRAIDFYNFQSELVKAHDAQELESAKHCLQHQTQQHALTQKDLSNQLRTLKYQLEAIVSERDAQVRLVQELQSRLQTPHSSHVPSRHSIPSGMPLSQSAAPSVSQVSTLPPSHATMFRRDDETLGIQERDHSASRNAPIRPWPPSHAPLVQHSGSNPSYEISPHTASAGERRTRIFSSSSPSSILPFNRQVLPSQSPTRGVMMVHHSSSDPRVTSSAPKHATPITPSSSTHERSPSTPTSMNTRPPSSSRGMPTSSRFGAMPTAPERPETPLLHRLAGASVRPHH